MVPTTRCFLASISGLVLAVALLASVTESSADPIRTPLPAPAESPSGAEPVDCADDADCPRLACGPCATGDVVTGNHTRVLCYRNPCPGAVAVCRDDVCVVR